MESDDEIQVASESELPFEVRQTLTLKPKRRAQRKNDKEKRENKNRPREESSKVRPRLEGPKLPNRTRDPRFDPLCGEFDKQAFYKSYNFLDPVREKEIKTLKKFLRTQPEDSNTRRKARSAIDRLQHFDKVKNQSLTSEGPSKAKFRRKADDKVGAVLEKYKKLSSENKLSSHVAKKAKRKWKSSL